MEQEKLRLRFTVQGFTPDETVNAYGDEVQSWKTRMTTAPWQTLYALSFQPRAPWLDAAGLFLYQVADAFQRQLTRQPDLELRREKITVEPDAETLRALSDSVPFVNGAQFVDAGWLCHAFAQMNERFAQEVAAFDGSVAMYLAGKSQQLRVPERIFFHLVESQDDAEYPFAFLATYATRTAAGKVRHMPLKYALSEYKGRRDKLLELLSCLNRVAEVAPLIAEFMEKGELFHPLRLCAEEAYQILKCVPAIEAAGIVCRIPNWWRRHAHGVSAAVVIGEEKTALLGLDTVLSMVPRLEVDGIPLRAQEIRDLLAQSEGLVLLKGRWVEVDHARLQQLLDAMDEQAGEVTMMEALRMELNGKKGANDPDQGVVIKNGTWLNELLARLRTPKQLRSVMVPRSLHATLRPYQKEGYTWLNQMNALHFGACLADDMGLGKTIQVLAFLARLRKHSAQARVLLIVPASLLGNWQGECERFVPDMPYVRLHGGGAKALGEFVAGDHTFLTITTYGMASRIAQLAQIEWDCLILDEAQAIKNPLSKQTKQIKKLHARMRIAMTGTPIENDLGNLWSLFDFLNKGLLGSFGEFREFCRDLGAHPEGYGRLKAMIAPFMLRRTKDDKRIIRDLPDKIETVDKVSLSARQAVLYRQCVNDLAKRLDELDGMQRRGLVLALLTKLKQICNHPDQYLGQEEYAPQESGKFAMLGELCETIYEKRERVLVFTQFKEITPYLDEYLAQRFHCRGFVLHGGTPVAERAKMVEAFQSERYVPYMVLSVRAGGTGLNLTNASHVIHFDRWWNPAVENQATDRAYRIGQKRNVMVHKLVCQGTVEEKIDQLIESKKELAANVIGSGGESWITEMSNEELLSLLKLEVDR